MSRIRQRAHEHFPAVLLTLISIIQALALELLWGKITGTESLWQADMVALVGWGMGAYRYSRYQAADREPASLAVEASAKARLERIVDAVALTRDLINTPANDMLPSHLEAAFRAVGEAHNAQVEVTVGDALLEAGYRTIHAVGRASDDAPRLLDMTWGDEGAPKVAIIGKGVCFDSGGLDIKPSSGMRMMKKDMREYLKLEVAQ